METTGQVGGDMGVGLKVGGQGGNGILRMLRGTAGQEGARHDRRRSLGLCKHWLMGWIVPQH